MATSTQANTLFFVSDEWCPYVCDNDERPGFLVEIVKEIAANNGIIVKFSLMPLARALVLTKKGEVDLILALTSQHIIDFQLTQSRFSFGGLYNDFYVQSSDKWRFTNISDLDKKLKSNTILGTINGYHYGEEISPLLDNNTDHVFAASGNSPLQKQLNMLQLGRVDIVLDSRFIVQYQLLKTPKSAIVYAGTEGEFIPLYLGFSSLLDKEQIQIFDDGLITLRQSGRLTEILAKYGLRDWLYQ